MPPACRFTREQIVAAALAITRERGFAAASVPQRIRSTRAITDSCATLGLSEIIRRIPGIRWLVLGIRKAKKA